MAHTFNYFHSIKVDGKTTSYYYLTNDYKQSLISYGDNVNIRHVSWNPVIFILFRDNPNF
jgi:hypothetical protein